MSRTSVSNLTLTVSTVEVFIQTVQYITEQEGLWDDIHAHLTENGKADMFVDFDFFRLTREVIMQQESCDRSHPVIKILRGHDDPDRKGKST